jgi:hypothetical protein
LCHPLLNLARTLHGSCQRVECARSLCSLRLPRLWRGRRTHVSCARSLRSLRLPPELQGVAGRTAFREQRLKPLGNLSVISPMARYF